MHAFLQHYACCLRVPIICWLKIRHKCSVGRVGVPWMICSVPRCSIHCLHLVFFSCSVLCLGFCVMQHVQCTCMYIVIAVHLPLVECSPELLELIEAHLPTVVSVQHGDHDPTCLLTERLVGTANPGCRQATLQLLCIDLTILLCIEIRQCTCRLWLTNLTYIQLKTIVVYSDVQLNRKAF